VLLALFIVSVYLFSIQRPSWQTSSFSQFVCMYVCILFIKEQYNSESDMVSHTKSKINLFSAGTCSVSVILQYAIVCCMVDNRPFIHATFYRPRNGVMMILVASVCLSVCLYMYVCMFVCSYFRKT